MKKLIILGFAWSFLTTTVQAGENLISDNSELIPTFFPLETQKVPSRIPESSAGKEHTLYSLLIAITVGMAIYSGTAINLPDFPVFGTKNKNYKRMITIFSVLGFLFFQFKAPKLNQERNLKRAARIYSDKRKQTS